MEEGGLLLDAVRRLIRPFCVEVIDFMRCVVRCYATSLSGAMSPLVSAGYVLLSKQFDVSVDDITSSFGALLLGLGIFMCVNRLCVCSRVQRPTFQARTEHPGGQIWPSHRVLDLRVPGERYFSLCIRQIERALSYPAQMFISCIWCALSPNLASIRASRVFQGFGMSAAQA